MTRSRMKRCNISGSRISNGPVVLKTERLHLTELSFDDADFILELLNEPTFKRFIGDKGIHTKDDALEYLRAVPLQQYEDHGYGLYRVAPGDNNVAAGICGLVTREEFPDPDLGFAFLNGHWGKGFAFESSLAVLAEGRDAFGLRRIIAMADEDNIASNRLLEKLGFRFEQMVTMPGETEEIRQYAIEEW